MGSLNTKTRVSGEEFNWQKSFVKGKRLKSGHYYLGPSPRKPELLEAIPDLINYWIELFANHSVLSRPLNGCTVQVNI